MAGRAAHGQLRVVGVDRSGADDDSVNRRAQAMEMIEALVAVDVAGLAGQRSDASVERLSELGDDEGPHGIGCRDTRERLGGRGRCTDVAHGASPA